MARIFLSHSHVDELFAAQLAHELRAGGCAVWSDEALRDGDFLRFIDQGLAWAEWLVLALSPDAIASSYVQSEVYAALHRTTLGHMRGVVPILVRPCEPGSIPPQWDVLHRYDATAPYALYDATLHVLHVVGLWFPEWETLAPIGPETLEPGIAVADFRFGYGRLTRLLPDGARADVSFGTEHPSVFVRIAGLRHA